MNNISLKFDKEFEQTNSIPPGLISLIGLLIENNSSSTSALQSTLTISGMIVYNFKKRIRKSKETSQNTVVNQNQLTKYETPIISYISLKLYSTVRSKNLIQKLHHIGICSSYNRVIGLLSGWAKTALQFYRDNDQVIPLKLRRGVFTVFTKDNIDKNSSSNQATKHFHGTSVCAFQSMKTITDGLIQINANSDSSPSVGDHTLPQSYTNVPQLINKCAQYSCPLPTVNVPDGICDDSILNDNRIEETKWMESILTSDPNLRK